MQMSLAEEMMSTLKVTRVATSRNNTHNVHRVLYNKKKKKKTWNTEWMMRKTGLENDGFINTVLLKSIYIKYVQAIHHNCYIWYNIKFK